MDQFKGKMNQQMGKMQNQFGQMKYKKDPKKHSYYKKEPDWKKDMNPYNINTGAPEMKQPYGNVAGQTSMPQQLNQHKQNLFNMCQKHHLYLVQVETVDGQMFEGIVDEFDDDGVTLLVPCGDEDRGDGFGGYGPGPGYGYGFGPGFGSQYGYGYPRRFSRFRRFRYPFFNLNRIFFPFFF